MFVVNAMMCDDTLEYGYHNEMPESTMVTTLTDALVEVGYLECVGGNFLTYRWL